MMKKTFLYSSLIIFLLAAAGCGQNILKGMEDKESNNAQQYAALKSLDSGDFLEVLKACDEGKADPLDCSAAALGAAGLDPIKIAQQLNDLIGTAATGSAIGTLSGLHPLYLGDIHDANIALKDKCEDVNNPDEEACSQLLVTSIAEIVIAIAQAGENTVDVSDGITAAEADDIALLIASNPTVLVDTDDDGTLDPTPILEVIKIAAVNIINNINDSPFGDTDGNGTADTELGQVIEDQVQAIGGADCAAGSTTCEVTAPELESYLDTQYGSSQP